MKKKQYYARLYAKEYHENSQNFGAEQHISFIENGNAIRAVNHYKRNAP